MNERKRTIEKSKRHSEKPREDKKREKLERAQLEFIENFFGSDLPGYLIGGYAEEALLNGRITEFHGDVDMLIPREGLNQIKEAINKLGADFTEKKLESSSLPYKLTVRYKNAFVVMSILDTVNDDAFYIEINNSGKRFRIYFSKEELEYPEQRLGNLIVKTVSPLLLMKSKKAVPLVGLFEPREKDIAAFVQLQQKFFPEESPKSTKFNPKIKQT